MNPDYFLEIWEICVQSGKIVKTTAKTVHITKSGAGGKSKETFSTWKASCSELQNAGRSSDIIKRNEDGSNLCAVIFFIIENLRSA